MKEILTNYATKHNYEPEDITSAWVNDYEQRNDVSCCMTIQNAIDSESHTSNTKLPQKIVSPRRNDKYDKGLSKIPAPIRSNTQLY